MAKKKGGKEKFSKKIGMTSAELGSPEFRGFSVARLGKISIMFPGYFFRRM
jgi:hypothetical protein